MNRTGLISAGINVDEFLERTMANEALIKRLVEKFLSDMNFANLTDAIRKGNMREAESCCHTLKGMCGNMSLTELFALFQKQLALFRNGYFNEAVAMMPKISSLYDRATENMRNWLEE